VILFSNNRPVLCKVSQFFPTILQTHRFGIQFQLEVRNIDISFFVFIDIYGFISKDNNFFLFFSLHLNSHHGERN